MDNWTIFTVFLNTFSFTLNASVLLILAPQGVHLFVHLLLLLYSASLLFLSVKGAKE